MAFLESTLKRHGYYCRSQRADGGITPRTRSCLPCARRKARCDKRRPECSRCIAKGIECHYPVNTPRGTGPSPQHQDDARNERRKVAAPLVVGPPYSIESRQEASNHSDVIFDNAPAISDPGFANLGGEFQLDWADSDIDFADFLIPQTNDGPVQYSSSGSSSSFGPSTPSTGPASQVQQPISAPINISIPRQPVNTVRSLAQRPKVNIAAGRTASLIFHTLKSYPRMMLRPNTLPPFIHPRLLYSDFGNDHMEPLTNCVNLVHMIGIGAQGSRKLFWKNVRLECERWCEEVRFPR